MKNISDIDKNFKIKTKIEKNDIIFLNSLSEPFKIYGVFHDDGKFRRIPESVAKSVSEGVHFLHANTAGGRIRFKTDSSYIAINVTMGNIEKAHHFPLSGSAGFDLYVKESGEERYTGSFIPPLTAEDSYESIVEFPTKKMRDVTINFPLYSEVKELYVGISQTASLNAPEPYAHEKPIVYYGSSITQGGCAHRPGTSYQSFISRRFDYNFINLGFSGNAKAEKEITDYIKKLDMSIFVYDYDHNAPDAEHLKNTHEKMFREIRKENPDLPIIMMSRPKFCLNDDEKERLNIVKTTYDNAILAGDKNVYFIPGPELMTYAGNDGTVDTCHPTDLGFYSMAKVLGDFLEKNIL